MTEVLHKFSTRILSPSLDNFFAGGKPATFTLVAQNKSNQYASFYLRLKAAGAQSTVDQTWYRVSPGQSYSIGPNDCIQFDVEILTLPPGREAFVGTLSLQAQLFSPELTDPKKPDVTPLTLHVVGTPVSDEDVSLFFSYPGSLLVLTPEETVSTSPRRWWAYGLGLIGFSLLLAMFLLRDHQATVTHAQFSDSTNHVISVAKNGSIIRRPAKHWIRWPRRISTLLTDDSKEDSSGSQKDSSDSKEDSSESKEDPPDSKEDSSDSKKGSPDSEKKAQLIEKTQAIEVVRYNPENENQIAVGFKNGEIALYDLRNRTGNREILSVKGVSQCGRSTHEGDRVFDLLFDSTGKKLYSAHGSGRILQWDVQTKELDQAQPCLQSAPNKTVNAVAFVNVLGKDYLAVAGHYNHLTLISQDGNAESNIILSPIAPESFSEYDEITSIAAAGDQSSILVTGDNKGNITLWDLSECFISIEKCKHSWRGHGGKHIRSVALSEDARCLVSGGDDGRVKLWLLSNGKEKASDQPKPLRPQGNAIVLRRSRRWLSLNPFTAHPIETVDVLVKNTNKNGKLFIASGGEDGKVRIQQRRCPSD